jgi:ribose 5-phosphate isomerase RpiB
LDRWGERRSGRESTGTGVVLGADDQGVGLLADVQEALEGRGLVRLGRHSRPPETWAAIGTAVGALVASEKGDVVAVTVTASAPGTAMAANRTPGARAIATTDPDEAATCRATLAANILCVDATAQARITDLLTAFLEAEPIEVPGIE